MKQSRSFVPVQFQKLVVWLVVGAGLLAYQNSYSGAFVFDDIPGIVENSHIRQLWHLGDILRHSSRPAVNLSLAFNYALGGLHPWGYHLFNVLVHILVALTLYGILRRTFSTDALRPAFGLAASSLAGAITLIWVVHPLQTESVIYTIQRGESLMSLFYLLTLYCVIRSNEAVRTGGWCIAAMASCALGMASKPVMVTAPLVTLLYDRSFLAKSWRDVWRRRRWLYAGLAASWFLLPPLLGNAPAEWKTSAGFEFSGIPPLQYAWLQSVAIVHYLCLTFWPQSPCLDYFWQFHWQERLKTSGALLDLLVVAALLMGTVWAWSRKAPLGFLGAWFFMILAPTSSFMPIADPIAEHRMYLPMAAVVTAVVVSIYLLGKEVRNIRLGVVLGWTVCGVALIPLIALTRQRNEDYQSEVAIWQDTVTKCPGNQRAQLNLGQALLPLGKVGDAIDHDQQAVRLRPDDLKAHNNLGLALAAAGRTQEAIEQYQQALRINANSAEAHVNLAVALRAAGRMQEAIEQSTLALQIEPNLAEAQNNIANVLVLLGRQQEAIERYRLALQIRPEYTEARHNLANILASLGRSEEAIEQYQQLLRANPSDANVHNNFANVLASMGRIGEAISHYQLALQIKPAFLEAQNNLATALTEAGKYQEAFDHYEQALRIKPDYAEGYFNFGNALMKAGMIQDAIRRYEQSLAIRPNYAEAHFNLGNALQREGNKGEAIEHYERALQIRPNLTEVQAALEQARFSVGVSKDLKQP